MFFFLSREPSVVTLLCASVCTWGGPREGAFGMSSFLVSLMEVCCVCVVASHHVRWKHPQPVVPGTQCVTRCRATSVCRPHSLLGRLLQTAFPSLSWLLVFCLFSLSRSLTHSRSLSLLRARGLPPPCPPPSPHHSVRSLPVWFARLPLPLHCVSCAPMI